MSFELVLFVLVAAVAIFSAALMLVSRNAVHSALFLVVNLLCVAFFYLMLSAPFLAMVQITVYAGAIMVLFMFVIMLLGAEKLSGGTSRYKWIAPGAVGMATVFLVVAFVTIVRGNVSLLKPVPPAPEIRFVHAVAEAAEVDIYLNNERVAHKVAFREASEFEEARAGQYNLSVFPACEDTEAGRCDPFAKGETPLLAVPVELKNETATTLVIAGRPEEFRLITVPTDLTPLADDNTFRLVAVNAMPGFDDLVLVREQGDKHTAVASGIDFGTASQTLVFPKDTYVFQWQQAESRVATVSDAHFKSRTFAMILLVPQTQLGASGEVIGIRPQPLALEPVRAEDVYGSPLQIGHNLLTTYLLPFEMVALLLLTTMVGAIILVREEVAKRVRRRVVVSPIVKRINKAMNAGGENNLPAGSNAALNAGETSGSEASAD